MDPAEVDPTKKFITRKLIDIIAESNCTNSKNLVIEAYDQEVDELLYSKVMQYLKCFISTFSKYKQQVQDTITGKETDLAGKEIESEVIYPKHEEHFTAQDMNECFMEDRRRSPEGSMFQTGILRVLSRKSESTQVKKENLTSEQPLTGLLEGPGIEIDEHSLTKKGIGDEGPLTKKRLGKKRHLRKSDRDALRRQVLTRNFLKYRRGGMEDHGLSSGQTQIGREEASPSSRRTVSKVPRFSPYHKGARGRPLLEIKKGPLTEKGSRDPGPSSRRIISKIPHFSQYHKGVRGPRLENKKGPLTKKRSGDRGPSSGHTEVERKVIVVPLFQPLPQQSPTSQPASERIR